MIIHWKSISWLFTKLSGYLGSVDKYIKKKLNTSRFGEIFQTSNTWYHEENNTWVLLLLFYTYLYIVHIHYKKPCHSNTCKILFYVPTYIKLHEFICIVINENNFFRSQIIFVYNKINYCCGLTIFWPAIKNYIICTTSKYRLLRLSLYGENI